MENKDWAILFLGIYWPAAIGSLTILWDPVKKVRRIVSCARQNLLRIRTCLFGQEFLNERLFGLERTVRLIDLAIILGPLFMSLFFGSLSIASLCWAECPSSAACKSSVAESIFSLLLLMVSITIALIESPAFATWKFGLLYDEKYPA